MPFYALQMQMCSLQEVSEVAMGGKKRGRKIGHMQVHSAKNKCRLCSPVGKMMIVHLSILFHLHFPGFAAYSSNQRINIRTALC